MAQRFVPVWDDWNMVTQELNAQEKGRLIDAIVAYGNGEDWQDLIKGNERYVFPGYMARLDRWQEVSAARVAAGKTGGRPAQATESKEKQTKANESKEKQTKANESKNKQTEANESKSKQVNVKGKGVIEEDEEERAPETPFGEIIVDPVIAVVQKELSGLTDDHYDDLAVFRKDLGDELVIEAVNEAVAHSTRSWAYVRKILSSYLRDGVKTVGEARARRNTYDRSGRNDTAGYDRGGKGKSPYSILRYQAV